MNALNDVGSTNNLNAYPNFESLINYNIFIESYDLNFYPIVAGVMILELSFVDSDGLNPSLPVDYILAQYNGNGSSMKFVKNYENRLIALNAQIKNLQAQLKVVRFNAASFDVYGMVMLRVDYNGNKS